MVIRKRNHCPDRGDLGWLSMNPQLGGVVLADQLKPLDWDQRNFEKIGICSEEQLACIISSATILLKL